VGEDMKGMIWPDEVPTEVAAQRDGNGPQQAAAPGSRGRSPKKKVGGSLRSAPVESMKIAERDDAQDAAEASGDEAPEKAAQAAERAHHAPPPAAAAGAKRDSAKSGKRELPPYLRVVK
jgi:hypothetical protein